MARCVRRFRMGKVCDVIEGMVRGNGVNVHDIAVYLQGEFSKSKDRDPGM